MPRCLDDAPPTALEEPFDQRVVERAGGKGCLDDHPQVRAGQAHDTVRATGDRRRDVVWRPAEQVGQDEHALGAAPDGGAKPLGKVVRGLVRREGDRV